MKCAALVLNVFGVLVAMWGVSDLATELGVPSPWRVLLAWVRDVVRRLLRRPTSVSSSGNVTIGPATLEATGSVHLPTIVNPTMEQRVAALEWALDQVRNEATQEARERALADRALRSDLEHETTERKAADQHLGDSVRRWVGGEGGRGLALTWLGLAMTLVGTMLGGFAD